MKTRTGMEIDIPRIVNTMASQSMRGKGNDTETHGCVST